MKYTLYTQSTQIGVMMHYNGAVAAKLLAARLAAGRDTASRSSSHVFQILYDVQARVSLSHLGGGSRPAAAALVALSPEPGMPIKLPSGLRELPGPLRILMAFQVSKAAALTANRFKDGRPEMDSRDSQVILSDIL